MGTYSIFSRRTMGLDNRVWRVMIILSLLSIVLLSYKITNRNNYTPFTFQIGGSSHLRDSIFYTDENILFTASVLSQKINWDFGDNSVSKEGPVVTHKFNKEGIYLVTASTGTQYDTSKLITVKNRPQPSFRNAPAPIVEIIGPSTTIVGRDEEFISPDLADSSYEWIVLNHREIATRYGPKTKFQFAFSGKYTIQLTLDNERVKSYTKEIYVKEDMTRAKPKGPDDVVPLIKDLPPIPKKTEEPATAVVQTPVAPPPTVPAAPKKKITSDEGFKSHLQSLVEEGMDEKEFYEYLCGEGSTPVVVNNDRKDFSNLCREIRGKKKRTGIVGLGGKRPVLITFVHLTRDESKCVIKIDVKYN